MDVTVTLSDTDTLRHLWIIPTDAMRKADGMVIRVPDHDPHDTLKATADRQSATILDALRRHGVTRVDWSSTSGRGWIQVNGREVGRIDATPTIPAQRTPDEDLSMEDATTGHRPGRLVFLGVGHRS